MSTASSNVSPGASPPAAQSETQVGDTEVSDAQIIETAIARLRQCSQVDLRAGWRGVEADISRHEALDPQFWARRAAMPLNEKGHVAWAGGRQVIWLGQVVTVPTALPIAQGYSVAGLSLRLALRWWARQAQVYVDGELVQEGDIFDCFARVPLCPSAAPGQEILVALRLVSPGHDAGALVQSLGLFERPEAGLDAGLGHRAGPEPGFVADEMAVLHQVLQRFEPDQLPTLAQALGLLPWDKLSDPAAFDAAIARLRQRLLPLGERVRQRQITLLGHAHLDLAWLWPISETWAVAEHTFESVLDLQQRFPELVFTHSTPALYAWVEAHRPELFQRICDRVAAGQWEVAAGLWVEPELTYVGGESVARQVLYGQRYVLERFGQLNRVAWLPDSFGFCGQLPQILRQGGIDYFATQKLRWNDTTQFPHEWFRWQAPDGTSVLGVNLPPIGTDIDPLPMATHLCDWETATGHPTALWLPGVGDHGGGPTADMLQHVRRWQRSPFFPQLAFGQAHDFLDQLPQADLPTWTQDLYLEFHRGCYTTHPDQKRWNRRCERQLYQAELFSALAAITAEKPYPYEALTAAWKTALFNQFHDILPGSAVRAVYEEVDPAWQETEATAVRITHSALEAIAAQIAIPAPPVHNGQPWALFNSLSWPRGGVVALPLSAGTRAYGEIDGEFKPLLCQVDAEAQTLLVQAENIPGVGYGLIWLDAGEPAVDSSLPTDLSPPPNYRLENEHLRVTLDDKTGAIAQIFDKARSREVLNGPGNQLQAFRDQGQYWDAWNIDPDYEQHPLPVALVSIKWRTHGPLRQCVRVVQRIGDSELQQDYVLDAGSPQLTIETHTRWQERHVLVKAAFPVAIAAEQALTETPFGVTARPTRPLDPTQQAPAQQAQWEVPALNWSDLSDPEQGCGVSLLSDYRHGYDFQAFRMRLTLLRGACWPDPQADAGDHAWRYSLYPHGGWGLRTVRLGYEQHHPLLPVHLSPSLSTSSNSRDSLPSTSTLLQMPQNVILSAFKRLEDGAGWALRGYECLGETAQSQPLLEVGQMAAAAADLLERVPPDKEGAAEDASAGDRPWQPWEIKTLVFKRLDAEAPSK
ncbi:MAG: alpha-mannosidase [Elainellaceae cyanobacterium]